MYVPPDLGKLTRRPSLGKFTSPPSPGPVSVLEPGLVPGLVPMLSPAAKGLRTDVRTHVAMVAQGHASRREWAVSQNGG